METLGTLIEAYEKQHISEIEGDPNHVLQLLMEHKGPFGNTGFTNEFRPCHRVLVQSFRNTLYFLNQAFLSVVVIHIGTLFQLIIESTSRLWNKGNLLTNYEI